MNVNGTAKGYGESLYGIYLGALAIALVSNLIIRLGARGEWLPPAGRVVLAIASAAPLAFAAVAFWRILRQQMDEMFQRIVLEGLAFALVVYLPLAALYVNLRAAGHAPRIDAPDLLLSPAILVAIGVALARHRYQ